jgi:Flp pilus assembly protein CpaB
MTYRTRNIFIAVALAVMAALLTSLYVSNYKRNVRTSEASVTVWVATKDVPANTSGADLIGKHLITKRDIARRNVVPGAISDPAEISKQLLVQPLYQGEQVTARRFGNQTELGVRSQLKGTQRAVEVTGEPYQLLIGTIKPGDHVDLVADVPLDDKEHISRVVLRDLLVLQAPESASTASKISSATGTGGAVVMLRVRDQQSSKLQWVMADGRQTEWTLTLRAPNKAADSPENLETLSTFVHDGVTQVELNRAFRGK